MKPFRCSTDYLYWAHQPGADDEQPLAKAIMQIVDNSREFALISQRELVEEIVDVAELYVGGRDTDLRAARVLKRARQWLRENA